MLEPVPVLWLLARLALGGVFLLAGLHKLRHQDEYAGLLQTLQKVPDSLKSLAQRTMPGLEIALGALLILGVITTIASLAAGVLLVLFATVLGLNARQVQRSGCNCGLPVESRDLRVLLARNGLLSLLAITVAVQGEQDLSLDAITTGAGSLAIAVVALLGAFLMLRGPRSGSDSRTASNASRRSFLRGALAVSAGLGLGALTGHVRPTEAACYGCGSCNPVYIWVSCTGNCCAAFFVKPREYCNNNCYSYCGGYFEEHCGYPQCC